MKDPKMIFNKEQFRDQVLKAVKILGEPVAATLGPEGLPILIERPNEKPIFTKDGVTVAKHICVDEIYNPIIEAMKESSKKTDDEAGDGTTTAIVIMRAILEEGIRYIKTGAITPQQLVSELKSYQQTIYDDLDKMALSINTVQDQFNVANISANGDGNIAQKIVEALEIAGEYGYISVEDGIERETTVNFLEGYTLPSGWRHLGPQGVTFINHTQKNTIEYIKPAILIYDGVLTDSNDLAIFCSTLTEGATKNIPLLIIAHGFQGDAFNLAVINKRHGLNIALLKCPMHGSTNSIRLILDDLAVFTGAKVIDFDSNAIISQALLRKENGEYLLKEGILGSCDKVIISEKDSVIYNGYGLESEIKKHIKILNSQILAAPSEWDQQLIKTRIGKLVGGVVEIGAGGSTELEMKERKFRVIDALKATRAAISHGIVPGGGIALLKIAVKFPNISIGQKVMQTALYSPLRQILLNAGLQPDIIIYEICNKIVFDKTAFFGYDARNKKYVDNMIESGIIDPVLVTKLALQNAISIACEALSGGGMLAINKKQKGLEKFLPEDLRPDLYLNDSNQEI